MKELWKDIPNYENHYQVSNTGKIRSIKKDKPLIMKSRKNNSGYLLIGIFKNGMREVLLLHRLIAMTFLKNPYFKKTVNHKDGNKLNNNLSNLEWNTLKENIQHASKNGMMKGNRTPGSTRPYTKLNWQNVKEIRDLISIYNCRQIAELYGVSKSNIEFIINKHTWK